MRGEVADATEHRTRNQANGSITHYADKFGRHELKLRMNVYNALNINTVLGTTVQSGANFGRVTSQGNYSRTMQITGRFSF